MMLKPLYDKVLVKRLKKQEKKGALYIPEASQGLPYEAEVIDVGEGRLMIDGTVKPLKVKKGDRIIFNIACGKDIKINDENYLILKEDEIFGVFREEA